MKLYIFYLFLLLGFFLCISCTRGVHVKTNKEIVELKNFKPVKGLHCESTSIMNALNYQGLVLSEPMINGFAGNLSFAFIENSEMPFLGIRVLDLLHPFVENTGLKCVEGYPVNPQQAYNEVKELLKKNIPVVLQVDMRYLPYRWGGKYGSKYTSFGMHFVTLVKIDETTGYAWVTETNEQELNLIEKIKISDLMKARGSKSRDKSMQPSFHYYYFENPKNNKIDYIKCLKKSLEMVKNNYNGECHALKELENLPGKIENIEFYIKTKYMLKPLFFTFYGFIEIFGSGGSSFRNFYRDYLIETGSITGDKMVKETALYVDASCNEWSKLANEFKIISDNIDKSYNNKSKRIEYYKKASTLATGLYLAEKEMYGKLQELCIDL